MTLNTLKDVYFDQLQDLYSACKQSLDITTELGRAATDEDLSKGLIDGGNGISKGMETLREICARHGLDPEEEYCKGMEGLVREARAHALDADIPDDAVRDAVIVTQYQRMVHYALAGYGSVVAFANRLDLDEDAGQLQAELDATYDGDRRMTEVATKGVNQKAA